MKGQWGSRAGVKTDPLLRRWSRAGSIGGLGRQAHRRRAASTAAHVQLRQAGRGRGAASAGGVGRSGDGGCRRGSHQRHHPVAHHRAAEPCVRGEDSVIEGQVDLRPRTRAAARERLQMVEDEVVR